MAYKSPYKKFIFEYYGFDDATSTAEFKYSFDGERHFTERLVITATCASKLLRSGKGGIQSYNSEALDRALQLAFYTAGTSYYKTFPTKEILFKQAIPDSWQAEFLTKIYHEGLSQFYFENKFELEDMPIFSGEGNSHSAVNYNGSGVLALQSGGKDSLLLATLLYQNNFAFTPWYIKYSQTYPQVLNQLGQPVQTVLRQIDKDALNKAKAEGALNGHVPVTYIVLSYALIDAILQGKNTVLAAIGAEGSEAHEFIGDMPVNHQWAKTWDAEQLFVNYVKNYISEDIQIGSPIRGYSELRIAELFVQNAWGKFGHSFSSCNRANYQQGSDNTQLKWCGECPKCANSYILFAPFVEPSELQSLFNGQDLFAKPLLTETFKGLLGIDGVMKPFECVGETDELRLAYHMAVEKFGNEKYRLPFNVPKSNFNYKKIRAHNQDLEPNLYNL